MLFNLSDAWAQSAESRTAEGQTEIKPLQIGDTIPEELWNLHLQVVGHPGGKDIVTLNDYRNKKLIILDFWATWCTVCIKGFPKIKDLQKENEGRLAILPVTYEQSSKISDFLLKHESAVIQNLSTVTDDERLKSVFPHRFLPYYVWIDSNGVVLTKTNGRAVNEANLRNYFENGTLDIRESKQLDFNQPLFVKNPHTEDEYYGSFYSSTEQPDIGRTNTKRYKEGKFYSWLLLNTTLSDLVINVARELYKQEKESFGTKKIIWEVDKHDLVLPNHSYEIILPLHRADLLASLVLSDLNQYSDFSMSLEEKEIDCLILDTTGIKKIPTAPATAIKERELIVTGKGKLINYSIASLVKAMNNYLDTDLHVINEVGDESPISVELNLLEDLDNVNVQLARYGLTLNKSKRNLKVFVVRESGNQTTLNSNTTNRTT